VKGSRVSKRYAKALFKEGKEKNKLDSLRQDLDQLAKIYQKSSEFQKVIDSPVIPTNTKEAVFKDIFQNKIDRMTFDFVLLLIRNGREHLLPEVVEFFGKILDDHHGIIRGEVYSVVSLSEDQLNELKSKLDRMTNKNVILTQSKDRSILGGFIVKISDSVIDASLRNQLSKMGEYLIEAN
jgi:F-type H+-transporting ATPase subunit delta